MGDVLLLVYFSFLFMLDCSLIVELELKYDSLELLIDDLTLTDEEKPELLEACLSRIRLEKFKAEGFM